MEQIRPGGGGVTAGANELVFNETVASLIVFLFFWIVLELHLMGLNMFTFPVNLNSQKLVRFFF